jgi:protein-disulfide isomerase
MKKRVFVLFVVLLCFSACWVLAQQKAAATGEVVAKVAGKPITAAELDEKAKAEIVKLKQQEFQLKKGILQNMINDMILEMELKAKNLTQDALMQAEIDYKLSSVPQKEVDDLLNRYKSQMQGTPEEQQKQIRKYLRQQALFKELNDKYKTEILLKAPELPRFNVSVGTAPTRGPKTAPITLIEYSDFECPFSKRAQDTLAELKKKYEGKILFCYKDYSLPFHKNAKKAAEAAHCAGEQGKYWEFHDKLFENQKALGDDKYKEIATGLGLNMEKFNGCLSTGKFAAEIEKESKEGAANGVNGTPGFFINGVMLSGAVPIDNFTDIIDKELAKNPAK